MERILYVFLISSLLVSCTKKEEKKQDVSMDGHYNGMNESSLTWSAPGGWIEETPSSPMRKAQYRLPKVEGDAEDASVSLFYFPGQGGSIEDNLNRWYGQFMQPDGKSTKDVAKVSKSTVNNLPQTTVDVSGTYLEQGRPMMRGPTTQKNNFRMLGGIVETENGPWFVKLTGPEKSVAKWHESFYTFMKSFNG